MPMLRPLAVRAASLLGVLVAVLFLLVLSLGATGFSDAMLEAVVGEELRAVRSGLAETIRDPEQLEVALAAQREQLEASYGLDRPWYARLPATVARVVTLDLGEAHTLRSFTGSNRVADIVLERLPNTVLLLTTAFAATAAIGILVGVRMAARAGTALDRGVSYFSAVSYALPAWWVGILLILAFAFYLELLPSGGMYNFGGSNPTVADSVFLNGLGSSQASGGMTNFDASAPLLENCHFIGNSGPFGGAMRNDGSSPSLYNSIFEGNFGWQRGGAIYNQDGSSPVVTGCIFNSNWATNFGSSGITGVVDEEGAGGPVVCCCANKNNRRPPGPG
jgi:hypothetical protein